jgi:predicted nicotinamide N-methyase
MGTTRLVEETVAVGDRVLAILHPPDAEALIDEAAFEREEFLPYWAELWPSAVTLAGVVAALPLEGRKVLELGCGLAVPALAAAAGGARVLATDWSRDAIALVPLNARRNGLDVEAAVVSWEQPARLLEDAPWDLVLASDVLYERRHTSVLLDLLPRLGEDVLITDPGRPASVEFVAGAEQRWTVEPERVGAVSLFRLRSK